MVPGQTTEKDLDTHIGGFTSVDWMAEMVDDGWGRHRQVFERVFGVRLPLRRVAALESIYEPR